MIKRLCLDLETKKKKRPGVAFEDGPTPVYRTVKALNFLYSGERACGKDKIGRSNNG
jgi:hypothetical protein